MIETAAKIEETAPSFRTDATNRVKIAIERGSKNMGDFAEYSKGNIEALVASGRAAAKGVEELAKNAREYGRASIETANAASGQLAAAKSPTEFLQIQSELAKSSVSAFVAEASKFGETYMHLLSEITQPIQHRYEVASEKVKTVVCV
jgi:phasin family protein